MKEIRIMARVAAGSSAFALLAPLAPYPPFASENMPSLMPPVAEAPVAVTPSAESQQLDDDRLNMVSRYGSCAVVGEVTTEPGAPEHILRRDTRPAPRETVRFTVEFKRTPEGVEALNRNRGGFSDHEVGTPQQRFLSALEHPTNPEELQINKKYGPLHGSDSRLTETDQEKATSALTQIRDYTLYPRSDYGPDAAVAIGIGTAVTSYDYESNTIEESSRVLECGSIVRQDNPDGTHAWVASDKHLPQMPVHTETSTLR